MADSFVRKELKILLQRRVSELLKKKQFLESLKQQELEKLQRLKQMEAKLEQTKAKAFWEILAKQQKQTRKIIIQRGLPKPKL